MTTDDDACISQKRFRGTHTCVYIYIHIHIYLHGHHVTGLSCDGCRIDGSKNVHVLSAMRKRPECFQGPIHNHPGVGSIYGPRKNLNTFLVYPMFYVPQDGYTQS